MRSRVIPPRNLEACTKPRVASNSGTDIILSGKNKCQSSSRFCFGEKSLTWMVQSCSSLISGVKMAWNKEGGVYLSAGDTCWIMLNLNRIRWFAMIGVAGTTATELPWHANPHGLSRRTDGDEAWVPVISMGSMRKCCTPLCTCRLWLR
jgi:hypothetical protein